MIDKPGDNASDLARWIRHRLPSVGAGYAVALAAGIAFILLGLPLPWLLGPLAVTIACAASGRTVGEERRLVQPLRSFIGVAIGSSFSSDVMAKAGSAVVSLSVVIPYTLAITALGYVLLRRLARFDKTTAFFGAAPGGFADMVLLAEAAGADMRRVSLIQISRVVTIVFALPFWMQFVGGLQLGGASPTALHLWEVGLVDALVICLLAWGGWTLADKAGLIGGSIIGPMILSALAHGAGLTDAKVPLEVIVLAQMTIGITVGNQFKGIKASEIGGIMSWGLVYAVLLLAIAGATALAVSRVTGLDPTALLLSYAPGGQNEMAIIGLILGVDVALIALHHLLRVVVVIVGAQAVLQRFLAKQPIR